MARPGRWSLKATFAILGMVSMLGGVAASAEPDAQGNKQGGKPAKDNKAKDNKAKDNKGHDHDTTIVVNIDSDGHRRVVRDYVTHGNLPPGLAKRRSLPPGLSQQLREKGALPPGLRDYYTAVPANWNGRLPVIPVYYTRYFVGRDLIIIDTRNDLIVSLIRDLLD